MSARIRRLRTLAWLPTCVAVLLATVTTPSHADWPTGLRLSYNNCYNNNVLAHPTRVIVGYWGWTGSSSYLEDAARAFASGDWSSSHTVTQYYQTPTCTDSKDYISLSALPVTVTSLLNPAPTSNYPSLLEEENAAYTFLQGYPPNSVILLMAYPPSVHPSCESNSSACHWRTEPAQGNLGYVDLPYSSLIPGMSGLLHHEIAELLTDTIPALQGSGYNHSAWWSTDPSVHIGGEIGDVCATGAPVRNFQLLPSSQPEHIFGRCPLMSNVAQNGAGSCVFAYSTRSDEFVLGTDANLYQSTNQTGSWWNWGHPAGVTLTSAPAAASHDPKFIDVYMYAGSGDMWHAATQDGGGSVVWQNWGHPIGYTLIGKPTLTSWGASRLDIYATARAALSTVLFHRSWDDGTDSGWQFVNTGIFTPGPSPGAASWGPNNVTLAVLAGSPAQLWTGTSSDGQNFTWTAAGNNGVLLDANAAPDIGSHDVNTADVFVTDLAGLLQQYSISNGVTFWDTALGNSGTPVKAGTGPSVVGRGDSRLMVAYTGNDNSVWQREYDFGWKPWVRVLWPAGTYVDGDLSSW